MRVTPSAMSEVTRKLATSSSTGRFPSSSVYRHMSANTPLKTPVNQVNTRMRISFALLGE